MKQLLLILAASLLIAGGVTAGISMATPPAGGPPGQGDCEHGNSGQECRPDPQPTNGQDCEEHGNNGGVNEDHCNPPPPPPPPPPTTNPPPTTTPPPTNPPPTTPPPAHNCTFVGADKDGGKDKFGGTNDDCAPAPDPPVTVPKTETSRAVAPTQAQTPLVSTVTVTPFKTPKAKPQPKRKPAATPKPDKPKVTKRAPARKKCPPNTRLFQGKCHPVVMGNG